MIKNKYPDRMNTNSASRIPFTNLSNQTLSPQTPNRTNSSLDSSRQNLTTRGMNLNTQMPQIRTDQYISQNSLQKEDRYLSQGTQPQYPQNSIPMNQSYPNMPPSVPSAHDTRYMQQQMMPQDRYSQQTRSPQQPYLNQNQGYSAYPAKQQVPPQMPQPQYHHHQNVGGNYLGQPQGQDPPVVPNRQGSYRRQPSARDTSGYSQQQAMSDHFDHYRQETPQQQQRQRHVIKQGRRIPSPQRLNYQQTRTSYGPDATPDSGVSESMDEMSPARKARLPPMIYADSHASSLLSFAPSEEDSRTLSPTISSIGLDSEMGSEASFPRTASLYVNPPSRRREIAAAGGGGGGGGGASDALRRKKSMPHGPKELASTPQKVIPREEVAYLSSQRREEVRRMQYEAERLRSNPLLYLVRPDLKVRTHVNFINVKFSETIQKYIPSSTIKKK